MSILTELYWLACRQSSVENAILNAIRDKEQTREGISLTLGMNPSTVYLILAGMEDAGTVTSRLQIVDIPGAQQLWRFYKKAEPNG